MPGSEPGDVVAPQQPSSATAPAAAGRASWSAPSGRRRRGSPAPPRPRVRRTRRSAWPGTPAPRRPGSAAAGWSARRPPPTPGCWWPRRRRRSCRPPACRAAPAASARSPGTWVSRSTPADLRRAGPRPCPRDRDDQRAGAVPRQRQHPLPDRRTVEVDGSDPRPPPHQRGQRPHLGPCAEHRDGVPLEPQPVGVGQHLPRPPRPRSARPPRPRPSASTPSSDAGAAQPFAVVGQHQLLDPFALALRPRRRVPELSVTGVRPVGQGVLARPADPAPASARAGTSSPCSATETAASGEAEPGLDQPAEVHEVVGAPAPSPAPPRAHRSGRSAAARRRRRRGPPPTCCAGPRRRREDQSVQLVGRHPAILPDPGGPRVPPRRLRPQHVD